MRESKASVWAQVTQAAHVWIYQCGRSTAWWKSVSSIRIYTQLNPALIAASRRLCAHEECLLSCLYAPSATSNANTQLTGLPLNNDSPKLEPRKWYSRLLKNTFFHLIFTTFKLFSSWGPEVMFPACYIYILVLVWHSDDRGFGPDITAGSVSDDVWGWRSISDLGSPVH